MKSTNPIFTRSAEFNGTAQSSSPATWGTGSANSNDGQYGRQPPMTEAPMTIDSVVQKTGISLFVVMVVAAITWVFIGDLGVVGEGAMTTAVTLMIIGAGAAFGLSLVNSFKKVISPALVLAFAVAEGVALGALSKVFDARFDGGIVTQAVLGTFAAFAGTLAAYKFFNIQVGAKFRTFVIAGMFGMVALGLLEMVLGAFGNSVGFFGFGGLGLLFAVAGLVLGIFMLILDFDFVERGVAAGIPERESWRAAFALTVSLVWIYTNLLRILAILQSD